MSKQQSINLRHETKVHQMLGIRDALLIKSGRNSYTQHAPCKTAMTIWNNCGHTVDSTGTTLPQTAFPLHWLSREALVFLNDHH